MLYVERGECLYKEGRWSLWGWRGDICRQMVYVGKGEGLLCISRWSV